MKTAGELWGKMWQCLRLANMTTDHLRIERLTAMAEKFEVRATAAEARESALVAMQFKRLRGSNDNGMDDNMAIVSDLKAARERQRALDLYSDLTE